MTWIRKSELTWLQKLALLVVRAGAIPKHVAFIMDGNRRFASKTRVKQADGHAKGFDKLAETLKWCLDLGITQVTVYAFSIENFKRSEEEVNTLMDLAREKLERLLEEEDELMREGVSITAIGDLSQLPEDLHKLIAQAVCTTKGNTRARLTIAFSYTARDEITHAVKCIVEGVADKSLQVNDVNSMLLEKCLYTENMDPPDLLVRTSGEVRFSDFLLWQSSHTCIYFTPVLWPEFDFWELLRAVFLYQRSMNALTGIERREHANSTRNERIDNFLSKLYEHRYNKLKMLACSV